MVSNRSAYLADVLTRIVNGHPNSQIDDLLPWVYINKLELKAVAREYRLLLTCTGRNRLTRISARCREHGCGRSC